VIEGGGGGGGFVPRVVAEQPAAKSTTRMLPSCSNLHIAEDTHLEPGKPVCSLGGGTVRGYWTKGQKWADVLDKGIRKPPTRARRLLKREA
jgi:hypothetical protein